MIKIVFTSGSCVGEQFLLDTSAPIVIGRSRSATVCLTPNLSDSGVSARHVEIGVDADGVYVTCLGKWGFKLNGRFIPYGERHALGLGDEVSMGVDTCFRVECLDVNVPKLANRFEESPIEAGENVAVDKSLEDDSAGWLGEAEGDGAEVPVASKSDWKAFDMPESHDTFFLHRPIPPAEMRILRRGHVPKEMEDKWFWYMQGDTLFAHRSWTGYCMYRIDFSPVNYHKVAVNRDAKQYKCTSVEEDREALNRLLEWWTRSPYDHRGEWLSETAIALRKAKAARRVGGEEEKAIDGLPREREGHLYRDRCKGMLWGLVVGDCLGSPIQFSGKDDHLWITEMVECPVFGLPPGYWTDDSSMAMCVMDSYMRKNGYDLHDIGNTFAKWFSEGYLSSVEGRAFDIGGATHAACRGIALGHEYVNGQESSQGNGSIMRFAPSYLIAQKERDPAKVMHEVSDLTHSATKVREVVDRLAKILDEHVAGRRTAEVSPYKSREEVNNSGWSVSTLDAALWAFNTTNSFEDGMVAAVNLGGDSDSIGAVYGQIAGAYYGFSAIPERWIRAVKTWESVDAMIEDFLDRLADGKPKLRSAAAIEAGEKHEGGKNTYRLCKEIGKIKRLFSANDEMAAVESMKRFIALEPKNVDAKIHFVILLWRSLTRSSPCMETFLEELHSEVERVVKESGDKVMDPRLRPVWESFCEGVSSEKSLSAVRPMMEMEYAVLAFLAFLGVLTWLVLR